MSTTEAFSRVKIDAQLKDVGWNLADGISVRFEYTLPDGTKADYVLCDRHGRAMALAEAKKASINPVAAEGQALGYAKQAGVPYVFLSNGQEIWFWEYEREARPRRVETFFSQGDLERPAAALVTQVDLLTVPVDKKIVERGYQLHCIQTLCGPDGTRKAPVLGGNGHGQPQYLMAAALTHVLL